MIMQPSSTEGMGEEERQVRVSPAATALAIYTLVIIGRVAEFFPSIRLALLTLIPTLVLALRLPRPKGPTLFQSAEARAAFALFVLAIVTSPLSVWPGQSFSHIVDVHLKVVLYLMLIIHGLRSLCDARKIVWGLLGAIVILEIGVFFSTEARVFVSDTYDPNDLAFVMVCTLPLITFLCVESRGVARYLAAIVAVLAVFSIILTQSRAGFVSFLVIGLLLLVRIPSRQPLLRLVFVLGSVLLFGAFASESYWQRMATIWGGDEIQGDVDEYDRGGLHEARWKVWMTGLRLMQENPLIGVGSGAYMTAEGMSHDGHGKWSAAHNSFIQVGTELGFPGLILFIYLLYGTVRNCRDVIRRARHDTRLTPYLWLANGLEISLYGYVVAAFPLSQGYSFLLYLFIGLSVVLKHLNTDLYSPELLRRRKQELSLVLLLSLLIVIR
jgi:O-antigen ligase